MLIYIYISFGFYLNYCELLYALQLESDESKNEQTRKKERKNRILAVLSYDV